MINDEIVNELNNSTGRLFLELGRFTPHSFNLTTIEGRWTAGQVAEHILLTDIAVLRVMQGGFEFAGRQPDEKVELIKATIGDRDRLIEAPATAIPSDSLKDPVTMQQKISIQRNAIVQFVKSIEEDSLCTARENRLFGLLTVTEWTWFTICHTDRHIEQLKMIEPGD